jgi:hypothetical protein
MGTFARISGGVVREVIREERLPTFTPEIAAQFRSAPDAVTEGWLYDGQDFSAPPPPPPPPTGQDLFDRGDLRAVIKGLVRAFARQRGLTEVQLLSAIRSELAEP